VIRQQMEGTRTALTEKLEKLETRLAEKVQETTTTIADTVESVSDTVENVSERVEGTVDAVKHTFDLKWQAEHHPWLLLGGAVLVGFVGTSLLLPPRRPEGRDREWDRERARQRDRQRGERQRERERERERQRQEARQEQPQHPAGGLFGALDHLLDLKKLGIGMAMGVVREMVAGSMPAAVANPLSDAVNRLTVKLGGQPLGTSEPDQETTHTPTPQQEHAFRESGD